MYPVGLMNGVLTPEHLTKMGAAFTSYVKLLDWQTRGNGAVKGGAAIQLEDLASAVGLSPRTVRRHLRQLVDQGYIEVNRRPYGLQIRILKAKKPFRSAANSGQSGAAKNGHSRADKNDRGSAKNGQSGAAKNGRSNKDYPGRDTQEDPEEPPSPPLGESPFADEARLFGELLEAHPNGHIGRSALGVWRARLTEAADPEAYHERCLAACRALAEIHRRDPGRPLPGLHSLCDRRWRDDWAEELRRTQADEMVERRRAADEQTLELIQSMTAKFGGIS